MKVLYVSSEVAPFAKTGGLADVSGALPVRLRSLGCDVRVMTPFYQCTRKAGLPYEVLFKSLKIPIGQTLHAGEILTVEHAESVPIYLLRHDGFFDRNQLYGTIQGDYPDNAERFIFFCRCALETCRRLQFVPEVIHCNDWQTGMMPAYIRNSSQTGGLFERTATVFTIHNIAYQGIFPKQMFGLTALPASFFNINGLEYWDNMSMLKAGLVYSDIITTVSRRYCREIQTEDYGCGMEGILAGRSNDLHGILNGADYTEWDPSHDQFIMSPYSIEDLKGKSDCKRDLLDAYQLPARLMERPVLGCISRLIGQKGLDLVAGIIEPLMRLDVGFVLLGMGDNKYQQLFTSIGKRYPQNAGIKIAYDNALAHRIEAGCDMFLMPSRFEPCGLNQIYSLRYGSIPIVRATGGLDDTIEDYDARSEKGNGFKFQQYSAAALLATIRRALRLYQDKPRWQQLIKTCMQYDFSWDSSARQYIELYQLAIAKKRDR